MRRAASRAARVTAVREISAEEHSRACAPCAYLVRLSTPLPSVVRRVQVVPIRTRQVHRAASHVAVASPVLAKSVVARLRVCAACVRRATLSTSRHRSAKNVAMAPTKTPPMRRAASRAARVTAVREISAEEHSRACAPCAHLALSSIEQYELAAHAQKVSTRTT